MVSLLSFQTIDYVSCFLVGCLITSNGNRDDKIPTLPAAGNNVEKSLCKVDLSGKVKLFSASWNTVAVGGVSALFSTPAMMTSALGTVGNGQRTKV